MLVVTSENAALIQASLIFFPIFFLDTLKLPLRGEVLIETSLEPVMHFCHRAW